MKKIISLLLIVALTLTIAPISAKAASTNYVTGHYEYSITVDGTEYDYFDFDIRDGGNPYVGLECRTYSMYEGETYYIYDGVTNTLISSFDFNGSKKVEFKVEYGRTYKFAISEYIYKTSEQIKNYFDGVYSPETVKIKSIDELGRDYCDRVSNFELSSSYIDRFNAAYNCSSKHAIYIDGKFYGNHAGAYNQIKWYTDTSDGKTKLKPGSKHTVKILPFATIAGINVLGTPVTGQVTVAPFTAPSAPKVTKLKKNMVSVKFTAPVKQRRAGLSTFYVYAGKKKVKTVKNSGKESYIFTIKKKGIAKKKISIKAICTLTKQKASSKGAKAKKNFVKWNQVKDIRYYTSLQGYLRPTKVYYSGKKLMMKGFYANGHVLKLKKFKIKFRLRVNGKIVLKKTITKKNLKPNSIKNFKVTLKKGKYFDLRNNNITWGYDVLADIV